MERTRWLVRSRQWETTRQQGWLRYVVLRVVLRHTTPLDLSLLLGAAIFCRLFYRDWHEFLIVVMVTFVADMVHSAITWIVNERIYHKPSSPSQDNPQ